MWEVGHWVVTVVRDYLAVIREVRVRNQLGKKRVTLGISNWVGGEWGN